VGALAALRHPERTAVIDERGSLTYAELERRAAALATALHARLEAGQRLGILCRNHRGFVEATLAGSRLGHDIVFLNTDFSSPQLEAVLDREGVAAIVTDAEFHPILDQTGFTGPRITAWSDHPAVPSAPSTDGRPPERRAATASSDGDGRGRRPTDTAASPDVTSPWRQGDARSSSAAAGYPTIDDLVAGTEAERIVAERESKMIILTSGTTGTPKGARHDISLATVLPAALTHAMRVPLRSGEPIVIAPPIFHTLGLAYLMNGLLMGMPVVLHRKFDPGAALEAVARHRAGALIVVPVMLSRLLDVPEQKRPDTSSLRAVVCAGAALHAEVARRFMDEFGDILRNVYGATETGWATIATPEDLRAAPGTVGRPSLGITVKILDTNGHELPAGETGEIFMGGGLKFAGYTGGGGKETRAGLTSTGDLGHFDAEGRLFIDGRADDMIVSGGENVFPAEVEALLETHPAVAEVAVVGVPDDKWGQRLAAHVVRAPEADTGPDEELAEELRTYVRDRLARYKVPRDVIFTDALPRTSTGKVQHRNLCTGPVHRAKARNQQGR
jgi:fatty-acyl-CoA synthase